MPMLQDYIITPKDVLDYFLTQVLEQHPELRLLLDRYPYQVRTLLSANGFLSALNFIINEFVKKETIKKVIAPIYDERINETLEYIFEQLNLPYKTDGFSLSKILVAEKKLYDFKKHYKKVKNPHSSFSEKSNAVIESIFAILSMSKLLKVQIPGITFNVKIFKIGYRTMYRYQGFQGYRDRFSNFYMKNRYRQLRLFMPNSFFIGPGRYHTERTWTYIRAFYHMGHNNTLDFWLYEDPRSQNYLTVKGIWGWKEEQGDAKAHLYFATFKTNYLRISDICSQHLRAKGLQNFQLANLNFYAADTRLFCYPITYYGQCDRPGSLKEQSF